MKYEYFDANVSEEDEDSLFVSVTHNGTSWTSLNLRSIEELKQLQQVIQKYLDEHNS